MIEKMESYLCINIALTMLSISCMFIAYVQKMEVLKIKSDAKELVEFITGK